MVVALAASHKNRKTGGEREVARADGDEVNAKYANYRAMAINVDDTH